MRVQRLPGAVPSNVHRGRFPGGLESPAVRESRFSEVVGEQGGVAGHNHFGVEQLVVLQFAAGKPAFKIIEQLSFPLHAIGLAVFEE